MGVQVEKSHSFRRTGSRDCVHIQTNKIRYCGKVESGAETVEDYPKTFRHSMLLSAYNVVGELVSTVNRMIFSTRVKAPNIHWLGSHIRSKHVVHAHIG